jgi:tyrosyl-tRNA synthetase
LVLLSSAEELAATRQRLESGENPMNVKLELASRVVERFNGEGSGDRARAEWERRFSKREQPSDIGLHALTGPADICSVLRAAGLVGSTSEARRLVSEGAVHLDERRVTDPAYRIDPALFGAETGILRIGRRRYVKIVAAE